MESCCSWRAVHEEKRRNRHIRSSCGDTGMHTCCGEQQIAFHLKRSIVTGGPGDSKLLCGPTRIEGKERCDSKGERRLEKHKAEKARTESAS